MQDAIHHRIAHVQVRRRHVDLGAQRARAVGKFARAHALEQVEVLFDRAIAIRAVFARLGQRAAILAHLFGAQIVDIRFARLDQLHRPGIELVEVVGGVEHPIAPVDAQPAHVVDDRVDVLLLFLLGIGVVEAQIGLAAELRRQARSSGRWTWRDRCADSRWAREESGSAPGRRTCWSSGLRG